MNDIFSACYEFILGWMQDVLTGSILTSNQGVDQHLYCHMVLLGHNELTNLLNSNTMNVFLTK